MALTSLRELLGRWTPPKAPASTEADAPAISPSAAAADPQGRAEVSLPE
jgi:hypothetical protein